MQVKKRRRGVFRAVSVPPGLLDQLDLVHDRNQGRKLRSATSGLFFGAAAARD
jgi:hypothetical protein